MDQSCSSQAEAAVSFSPIGVLKTVFLHKNGTPRQPTVCRSSRATLTIRKSVFNNPDHSLQGLEEYSHVWLLFVFHLNNNACTKAKVKPPRLNGVKLGLFATRSPYRPVPIGLTLAKVESIEGATLHLSGVDIVNGTPILDVKPFIPEYDSPLDLHVPHLQSQYGSEVTELNSNCSSEVTQSDSRVGAEVTYSEGSTEVTHSGGRTEVTHSDGSSEVAQSDGSTEVTQSDGRVGTEVTQSIGDNAVTTHRSKDVATSQLLNKDAVHAATWLKKTESDINEVLFTRRALEQLSKFKYDDDSEYSLSFLQTVGEAKRAITDILIADPRSPYRRKSCSDRLYYFTLDTMHITCWFDVTTVEVLKVQPVSTAAHLTDIRLHDSC